MSSTINVLEEPSAVSLERPVSSIPTSLRAEFIAGIISLIVSPVVLLLLALYYLRRRRRRLRQEQAEPDAKTASGSDDYSIRPFDVAATAADPPSADAKPVLETEKPRRAADADARRSTAAASLDDPEKLAALRRVMRQAGVTLDAMVVGLRRVARIPSYRSTGSAGTRPPHSPPGYDVGD